MTRIFHRKKVKANFPATPNFQIIYIFLQLEKWIISILGTRLKFYVSKSQLFGSSRLVKRKEGSVILPAGNAVRGACYVAPPLDSLT